jgi:hypothetical protein
MFLEKPVFSGEFNAFSLFDRLVLRNLINRIEKPAPRMIEIGSWLGNGSTTVFVEELRKKNGLLYCVDTFKGNPNVERHQAIVNHYDVLQTFRRNVAAARGEDLVKILAMSSEDAAAVMADESFDLVFIDADHSYHSTRQDIDWWRSKVKKGGILCGHDCEGRPQHFDRNRLLDNIHNDTAPGNNRFSVVHPGPVLAVDEAFNGQAHLWAEEIILGPKGIVGRSTIWDLVAD